MAAASLAVLAALALLLVRQAYCEDLREVFLTKRCLPADREALFPSFRYERLWVLEANRWASQRITTAIAAILLREHAGYGIDLNVVPSSAGAYRRLTKRWSANAAEDGAAVAAHLEAQRSFGYANLEIWPAGLRDPDLESLVEDRSLVDSGEVGYEGRSGWFVAESFARDANFRMTPEFYRAYDTASPGNAAVLESLRAHSGVACNSTACSSASAVSCTDPGRGDGGGDLLWCPKGLDRTLPSVFSTAPDMDMGYQEEIAHSNGMDFALRYVGFDAFAHQATEALARGDAQVVHAWRPSTFLARLRSLGVPTVRVMMPSDHCGMHFPNGTGDWRCDFPPQALRKLASPEVRRDPVIKQFLKAFHIPESRTNWPADVGEPSLTDAGMQELVALLADDPLPNALRPPTAEEIFDTACQWVRENEGRWSSWIEARRVPFFADTAHSWYPLPTLAAVLVVSILYAVFIEIPWLNTTFNPRNWRRILTRAPSCRTDLERRLRKNAPVIKANSKLLRVGSRQLEKRDVQVGVPEEFWKGLLERAMEVPRVQAFWSRLEAWVAQARESSPQQQEDSASQGDFVFLAHHTFPCLQAAGRVSIPICRSDAGVASGKEVEVELSVEECGGGAKAGRDFKAGKQMVVLLPRQECVVVHVDVVNHVDTWQNSSWFCARLTKVVRGPAMLAAPAEATVLVLSDNVWPANIPEAKRGGWGISLMRYFIYADRVRRGEKWTKTLLAMIWLPVHTVFVSTIVQKMLVDHAAQGILQAGTSGNVDWLYWECVILVLVQLISLGLCRWADVVQTRNRGRTGGIRQVHRGDLLRKYMFLDHPEHWEATDASWLYAAVYDADVITNKAYFQVFVLAQSCFALFLAVILVLGLAYWGYAIKLSSGDSAAAPGTTQTLWYCMGLLILIPLGLSGVVLRRKLTWVAVIVRKDLESAWFNSCTWIVMAWRHFWAMEGTEKVALEKRVLKQNGDFVNAHWDARDVMNDTAFLTNWIQGISYCAVLLFGTFELIDYQTYGIGAMEVGTFYALCKIYLTVGKYLGLLSSVFVDMQLAVVSLREVAALLNQHSQRSKRRAAKQWERAGSLGRCTSGVLQGHSRTVPLENLGIRFGHGTCFVRPASYRVGSTFAELRVKACTLPLGCVVHVTGRNERVLRSFLGLAAQVIHPTTERGEELELSDNAHGVWVPKGLKVMMLPYGPIAVGTTAPSILEQLGFTGVPRNLCAALAASVGLEPDRETASLGTGSAQVFSIIRALLLDPDVLCAYRPLSIVPLDIQPRLAMMLRAWQGGGLPLIAEMLGEAQVSDPPVYRPGRRSLIMGNPQLEHWGGWPNDEHVDLEDILWKESMPILPTVGTQGTTTPASTPASDSPPTTTESAWQWGSGTPAGHEPGAPVQVARALRCL